MEQFKVGDWVRELNPLPFAKEVYQLSDSDFYGVGRKSNIYFENIEKWQPKEGEWCWSKKRNELTNNVCELIRFYWDNANIGDCEPFIGELPSFLKDKKCLEKYYALLVGIHIQPHLKIILNNLGVYHLMVELQTM